MDKKDFFKANDRLISWIVVVALLLAALLYAFIQYAYFRPRMNGWQLFFEVAFLLSLGGTVFWLTRYVLRLQNRLKAEQRQVEEATRRLSAVLQLRQKFMDAENEQDIIQALLSLAVEITAASGASLVPLDERGQPMVAIKYGEMPASVSEAWVEYLAFPAVREKCPVCQKRYELTTVCPLLKGSFVEASGIYCFPLRKGEQDYGVLNLYFADPAQLTAEKRAFLQAIVDETILALESVWLRKRELTTLRQLQAVRQKADLSSALSELMNPVLQFLEADFALLETVDLDDSKAGDPLAKLHQHWIHGELPDHSLSFISSVVQGVFSSGQPVILGNVSGDSASSSKLSAVAAAPLLSQSQSPVGVLLVGSQRVKNFHPRHLPLLQTVAAQIALMIQSNRQLATLEYQTMIEERARLAREIHDGLAQTLGFLKLQVAQMQSLLESGDLQRLRGNLRVVYETLAEAYREARNAIDDLRISSLGNHIQAWLPQVVDEFRENSEGTLQVSLEHLDLRAELPPEVQAQLIRILQEALSNVRKHAGASHVWVSCTQVNGDLVLEIRDDGRGFSPEDVPGPSQHGLRGMRERVELIGADFQVISQPQKGTTIRVSVPLKVREIIV